MAEGLRAAYGDAVPLVDPAEAMLQAVSWKYFEVVALRARVAELGEEAMVWGRTRVKTGTGVAAGGDAGVEGSEREGGSKNESGGESSGEAIASDVGGSEVVTEARANLWWTMLRSAEDQLVKFAAAARAAGVDERRLEVEQGRVRLVALAFGKALDAVELNADQRERATRVLLAELRADEDGGEVAGELE